MAFLVAAIFLGCLVVAIFLAGFASVGRMLRMKVAAHGGVISALSSAGLSRRG
jgi:hypothetical protein